MQISDYLHFFPASGYRHNQTGAPNTRGANAYYWSSSAATATSGWRMRFDSGNVTVNNPNRTEGDAVRCVAQVLATTAVFAVITILIHFVFILLYAKNNTL